jgi:ABC-2 type transport system permease protein
VIFGIATGARAIGGSEEEGEVELLLAHPITRRQLVVERFLGVVGLTTALGLVYAVLLFVLGPMFGALDGLRPVRLAAACAGAIALGLVHAAVAFTTGAVTGRRSTAVAVATSVAGAGYVLHGLLAAAGAPEASRFASPWFWFLRRNMLVEGVDAVAFVLPLATVAVLFVAAWAVFDRRDLT